MPACERCGGLLVLKCQHAGCTSVKVRFEGLVVFANGGVILEAGIQVAVPNDEAAFWLQRAVGEVVCQFDRLHRLPRLLMIGKRTRGATVIRTLPIHDGHGLHVGMDGSRAGLARLSIALIDIAPPRVSETSQDKHGDETCEYAPSLHYGPSLALSYTCESGFVARVRFAHRRLLSEVLQLLSPQVNSHLAVDLVSLRTPSGTITCRSSADWLSKCLQRVCQCSPCR